MLNNRLGRRTYFEKVVWYSSVVYKSNESILSTKFSPNSVGYVDSLKEPLPKNYEIAKENGTTAEGVEYFKDQIIKITYTSTGDIVKTPLFKKSKYMGTKKPKTLDDFYSDEKLTDFSNKQKYPLPQGTFYCKVSSAFDLNTANAQDFLHFQSHSVQIETKDDIKGIKKDDYIYFRQLWWRCDGIQVREINKIKQFSKETDSIKILFLVR